MANDTVQGSAHQCHSHKRMLLSSTADLKSLNCPATINSTIIGRQNFVFEGASLFSFIGMFFLEDRLIFIL